MAVMVRQHAGEAVILKRRKRERSGIKDDAGPVRCREHLAHVRGYRCTVESHHCLGRMEAHHVREGLAGIGTKPGDDCVVPLCAKHHMELHHYGRQTFEAKHKVDLDRIAADLWAKSPHRLKWEGDRNDAQPLIAERSKA